jgi:Ca2+-binding EF-hand superfamily protein
MGKVKILIFAGIITAITGFVSVAGALTIGTMSEIMPPSDASAVQEAGGGSQGIPVDAVEAIPIIGEGVANLRQSLKIIKTARGNEVLIKAAKIIDVNSVEEGNIGLIKISIFGYQYTVITPKETKILKSSWTASKLTEFSVGDIVNVWGFLDKNDNYRINARTVRNMSVQTKHIAVKGVITLLGEGSEGSGKMFQLSGARIDPRLIERQKQLFTVAVEQNTKIIKGREVVPFSELRVGMRVIVRGILLSGTNIKALVVQIITPPCVAQYDEKADINRDGKVDVADLALFGKAFGSTSANETDYNANADYDKDGDVDGSDLAVFSEAFKKTNKKIKYDKRADIDKDGDVDGSDLTLFMKTFGTISGKHENYKAEADYDSDGDVDGVDLAKFVKAFTSSFGFVCEIPKGKARKTPMPFEDRIGGAHKTDKGKGITNKNSGRETNRTERIRSIKTQISELLKRVRDIQLRIKNSQYSQ